MASIKKALATTASHSISKLKLSEPVRASLVGIQEELAEAYRDRFIEMTTALTLQASALDRIQETLRLLVGHLAPQLTGHVPAVVRIAQPDEKPDLASAMVVADPIGAGYMLSQADLAKALALKGPEVSVLVRAFKLSEDGRCAVTVRKGSRAAIVNFHPRAIDRFLELVKNPPDGLTDPQKAALKRVRTKLG